ncbi:CDIPT isoform 9 [Pan troglodytes]|uniref:CDP-diacylglycerol--inositol 3-phosphatidyltransferase n=3 Tax=Hominidae TaxID=9604 RepID=H3BTJ7_HUMAN|nr:CDIPT isoform 9 [Pan troglodytes]PNJ33450.1 CDIPT isoform 3 [Pongo abelii]
MPDENIFLFVPNLIAACWTLSMDTLLALLIKEPGLGPCWTC